MIFKKSSPQKIGTMISALEADWAEAKEIVANTKRSIAEAILALREGAPGARETLVKQESILAKAEADANGLENALVIAKEKYRETLDQEHNKGIEKRWNDAKTIAKERYDLALSIEMDTIALVDKLKAFKETGAALYDVAPNKDQSLAYSNLGPGIIDNHFRFLLLSLGCQWANSWHYGDLTIPKFLEQTEEAHNWILAQKDRPQKQAAQKNAQI